LAEHSTLYEKEERYERVNLGGIRGERETGTPFIGLGKAKGKVGERNEESSGDWDELPAAASV
jgi:hypothetical protein